MSDTLGHDDLEFVAEAEGQVRRVHDAYRAGTLRLNDRVLSALSRIMDQLVATRIDASSDPAAAGRRDAACAQISEMVREAAAAPGFAEAPPVAASAQASPRPDPAWPPPPPPASYSYPRWAPPALPYPRRRTWKMIALVTGAVVVTVVALAVIGAIAGKNKDGANSQNQAGAAAAAVNGGTAPRGFTAFRSTADHFSIDVPKTWKAVDPRSPGAQATMNELEQSNPDLRSSFASNAIQLAEEGTALLAINPVAGSDGFASNINVVAKPDLTFSTSDLSQIAASLPAEYAKIGGTVTGTSYLAFDGHQALRSTDILSLNTPLGGHVNVEQTQYFVGANGFLYVLTLSGTDPDLAAIASSFSTS